MSKSEIASLYKKYIVQNLDDSSDEEDNYQDHPDLSEAIEYFAQQNPNIDQDTVATAFILEDQGRRVIYNKKVREKYYKTKKKEFSYDEQLINDAINKLDFAVILENSVKKVINELDLSAANYDNTIKEDIRKITPQEKLIAAVLNQSNKEFLNKVFAKNFEILIRMLSLTKFINDRKPIDKSQYQIMGKKLLAVEDIKVSLVEKVNTKLEFLHKFYHENGKLNYDNYKNKVKEILGVEYNHAEFRDSIENSITREEYQKPNGNALNSFIEKALDKEIQLYLKDGFIDVTQGDVNIQDSIFLNDAIEKARNEGYASITNCTKTMYEAAKKPTPEIYFEKIKSDFGLILSKVLKEKLETNLKIERSTLKTTYTDLSKINNIGDFYAKEHSIYRSAVRQSRNNVKREIARTIVFEEKEDLSVQKWQDIKPQKDASDKHLIYRGTIQEEVYDLGNYERVLEKINNIKNIEGKNFTDKTAARMIRNVYKFGIDGLEQLTHEFDGNKSVPLSNFMTHEQKQTVIELVELFFGTEGFRSPSAITEMNMALDLIIEGKKSWKDLLTGKNTTGKGGDLSFSMKSKEDAGGIELGRQLSEDVNQHHSRMHKYGGEPIGRNSVGYKEYLSRKKDVVDSWVETVGKKDPATLTVQQKVSMIKARDKDWYNGL